MATALIDAMARMINAQITSKKQEKNKNVASMMPSQPIVKVSYSALIGLLMLAFVAVGTQSCSSGDDDDTSQTDVKANEVSTALKDLITTVGGQVVTTKSGVGDKGDVQSFSIKYPYINSKNWDMNASTNATLNSEKSTDAERVYNTNEIVKFGYDGSTAYTANGTLTITKETDGTIVARHIETSTDGQKTDVTYTFKKNSDSSYTMKDLYYGTEEKVVSAGIGKVAVGTGTEHARVDTLTAVVKE